MFSTGFAFVLALAMPFLVEALRYSPRLGFLGALGMWLAPVPCIALVHRSLHGVLDLGDRKASLPGKDGPLESIWAGVYSWLVLVFTMVTTSLVMLVLNPPPPPEPESLLFGMARSFTTAPSLTMPSVRMVVWIVIAAGLFHLESVVRQRQDGTSSG